MLREIFCLLVIFAPAYSGNQPKYSRILKTFFHSDDVETLTVTFYESLTQQIDTEMFFGMKVPAKMASKVLYTTDIRVFKELGVKNPGCSAAAASRAVGLLDPFTLPVYFKNAAYCLAAFLKNHQILNHRNAEEIGRKFSMYVLDELNYLDGRQMASYIEAALKGIGSIVKEYEADVADDVWDEMADFFIFEYKREHMFTAKKSCH